MNINYRRLGAAAIAGVILTSGIGIVVAQLPTEDGLAITREIYDDLFKSFDDGACRLQYKTTTVAWRDDQPVEAVANVEYLASNDRMHVTSEEYSVYEDTTVTVAVIANEKTIFIAPSSPKELRNRRREIIEQGRDALLSEGKTIGWRKIGEDDSPGSDRMLILKPSDAMTRSLMVDTVTIYLNTREKTLQKVRMSYPDSTGIAMVEMEYGSIERIDVPDEFSRPVLRTFFDESNRLLPEYEGYTVQDMRGRRPGFPKRTK